MRFLISRAFNTNNNEQVTGMPNWMDTERFDIIAKAPSADRRRRDGHENAGADDRALLADRFQNDIPHGRSGRYPLIRLVPAKPKMKKADPASRTTCKSANAACRRPAVRRFLTAEHHHGAVCGSLQNMAPELGWPVLDATGSRRLDFTLTFSRNAGMTMGTAAAETRGRRRRHAVGVGADWRLDSFPGSGKAGRAKAGDA